MLLSVLKALSTEEFEPDKQIISSASRHKFGNSVLRNSSVPFQTLESFRLTFFVITANGKPVVDVAVTRYRFGI